MSSPADDSNCPEPLPSCLPFPSAGDIPPASEPQQNATNQAGPLFLPQNPADAIRQLALSMQPADIRQAFADPSTPVKPGSFTEIMRNYISHLGRQQAADLVNATVSKVNTGTTSADNSAGLSGTVTSGSTASEPLITVSDVVPVNAQIPVEIPSCSCSIPGLQQALVSGLSSGIQPLTDAVTKLVEFQLNLESDLQSTIDKVSLNLAGVTGNVCGQCSQALNQCQQTVDRCENKILDQLTAIMSEVTANMSALYSSFQTGEQPSQPTQGNLPAAFFPPFFPEPPPVEPAILGGIIGAGFAGQRGNAANATATITIKIDNPGFSGQTINITVNANATANAIAAAVASAIANAPPPQPAQRPQPAPQAKPDKISVDQNVQVDETCCIPPLVPVEGNPPPDRYNDPVCAESQFKWVSGPKIIIQSPDCWQVTQAPCIDITDSDGHPTLP